MPSCSECSKLVAGKCAAFEQAQAEFGRDVNPIGACVIPIVEEYRRQIRGGMSVLEIGCGTWDALVSHCKSVGARYEGVDSSEFYYDKRTIATRIENLRDLSFADREFDFVIGNQTMEHWGEYGCPLDVGIYQCFRVCKLGGRVMLNVPIHFHGTRDFLIGDMARIRTRFERYSSNIKMETWRRDAAPLEPYLPRDDYWVLRNKPAYVLAIDAICDRESRSRPTFRKNIPVQLLRTLNYPFSFNVVRSFRKASALVDRLIH